MIRDTMRTCTCTEHHAVSRSSPFGRLPIHIYTNVHINRWNGMYTQVTQYIQGCMMGTLLRPLSRHCNTSVISSRTESSTYTVGHWVVYDTVVTIHTMIQWCCVQSPLQHQNTRNGASNCLRCAFQRGCGGCGCGCDVCVCVCLYVFVCCSPSNNISRRSPMSDTL
jgi:hypothetical protein